MMRLLPELRLFEWLLRMFAVCLMLASVSVSVSGCEPQPPKPLTAGITGYNFTGEGVQSYSVNDNYGSNLPPYGGGGALSCCVSLPSEWRPDVTVEVDWTIGHYTQPWEKRKNMTLAEESKCCWTERTIRRTVAVERYGKEGGRLQVFFLPNDQIQVWVYEAGPQSADHPSHRGYPERPAAKD